jgi:hypothetical protein
MQRTNAYYYPNRVDVLADINPNLTTRNKIVYARTIKFNRGINNTVVFYLKDSDQKPVDLLGFTAYMSVIDDDDNSIFLETEGTAVNAQKGIFSVTVDSNDLDLFEKEFYNYALKLVQDDNGDEYPVYTDDFFTVRGQLQVLDGYLPSFRPSRQLTLTNLSTEVVISSAASGGYPTGYNNLHSFQLYFNNFTGTVIPQVTNVPIGEIEENSWVSLPSTGYSGRSDSDYMNFEGPYTAIRFRIEVTSGSVTKILSRS